MRIKLYVATSTFLVGLIFLALNFQSDIDSSNNHSYAMDRISYEAFLQNHAFNRRLSSSELAEIPKQDRPDLAFEQNFMATLDPSTGKPEMERLFPIMAQTKKMQQLASRTPGSTTSPWVERGPNNVAGRTRALAWDPISTNKVWAGGVSGGLWYNTNITSNTSSWFAVNDFWDNIAVTAIAFDPNNSTIMYVATGESYASANRGAGIWKSSNGGASFSPLSSTSSFYYINDMVIRNENGTSVIYAAVAESYYAGSWHGSDGGLQRSVNGGSSWSQVMPNSGGSPVQPSDLDIASDNELWVGTKGNSSGSGGGRVYSSTSGTTFSLKYAHSQSGRVNLACAPSNSDYVYALFESNSQLDAVKLTVNDGASWSTQAEPNDADTDIPATDFTRGQAWYDLTIDVDPMNMNTIIAGGIDLFKSTNAGSSWTQLSHWYGGFGFPEIHADQHAIVYKPGSSSTVIFGNDGGVAYSSNMTSFSPAMNARNKDYNVTQFYACAIHPTAASNEYLAGAQDNGTQQYGSTGINSTTEVLGGDGAFCHIDQTNGNYQSAQYVYNVINHSDDGFNSSTRILNDQTTGRFINPSDLDDTQNILYSYKSQTSLYKISGFQSSFPSPATVTISSLLSPASCLKVSPYTTSSSTIFVGTTSGRLFQISNANTTPVKTEISGSSFPTGAISCIEFGQNENQIIVTFSNYGVNSVWYTSNGGASWISKEGNLPDMPVRWALFNPLNYDEVILATEVGIWASTNFGQSSPTWNPSNSGLANVRVDMLQLRASDNQVIAATHGRGLFSSNGFVAGSNPATYCAATSSSNPCDEFISNVTVGSINNTTTCGNYSDYTSQTTSMSSGTSVAMTVATATVGGTGAGYTNDQVAVWIDWNNDGDFYDANEEVYSVTYGTTTVLPLSFNVNVPANLQTATVGMRVRMSYLTVDGPIGPCGTSTWGEVEDYSINILGATPSLCVATSTQSPCDEYISNVTMGTINNTSTCGNYSDYSNQVNAVQQGAFVPMTITTSVVGATTSGYTDDQVAVWVDWNNDLDFSDPGELVFTETYSTTTPIPLSFNVGVPSNAWIGNVRMRVRMSYLNVDGPISPCGSSQWGEVEDYVLNVSQATAITWTGQPGTQNLECDASFMPANTGNATATTTCAGNAVLSYIDNITSNGCANDFTVSRVWTAVDGCGGSATYTQIINVSDNTDPVIDCPADQVINSSNGIDAVLLDFIGLASVTDNCTNTANITLGQSPAPGSIQNIGNVSVTLTATDECGNTNACVFNVEVKNATSVNDISLNEITVYPNPTEGDIYINLGELKNTVTAIKVYDVVGKELFYTNELDGQTLQNISLDFIIKGVVFVEISTSTNVVVKRILKL